MRHKAEYSIYPQADFQNSGHTFLPNFPYFPWNGERSMLIIPWTPGYTLSFRVLVCLFDLSRDMTKPTK